MLIRHGYQITIACEAPTAIVAMLTVHYERIGDARRPEVFTTTPQVASSLYRDLFGNLCRRLIAPAGLLTLYSDSVTYDTGAHDPAFPTAIQHPVADLPDDCLVYLMGSRYCETDRLSQIAWDLFGGTEPGWGRVQAICDFVHGHIRFDYLQASVTRGAYDAWLGQTGVCRDFAHLAVAFCRCMNIPARYVNGYMGDIGVPVVDPMDFSAWMEVYLGGAWRTFDPRNNIPRIGRIVIARGRDAADVAMLTSFGPHELVGFEVWAKEDTSV
ncbi:MAG: transglutaminase [Caulobacteraceae bacterium]|nr:transglutaminase [Caulobacteraceae bacterium]